MSITLDITILLCLLVVWTAFVWAIGLYALIEYGMLAIGREEPTEPDTATLAAQIGAAALARREGKQ